MSKINSIKRQNHEAMTLNEHFRGSDTLDGKFDGKDIDKQVVEDADLREILRVM